MTLELKKLEKKIDITFKDKNLLVKSFTHKSYDPIFNNEKLEFLGDRVLGLVISKKLLEIYPDEKEGILDKKLASLVNRKKCLEIAKSIKLENFILILGNKKKMKIEDKIISDSCEALIGAIYLDQGIKNVEKVILRLWDKDLKASIITFVDSKTKLQEYSLKKYKVLPKYIFFKKTGPQHKPTFKTEVQIPKSKKISGEGKSKKAAQQNAAKKLLENLKIL